MQLISNRTGVAVAIFSQVVFASLLFSLTRYDSSWLLWATFLVFSQGHLILALTLVIKYRAGFFPLAEHWWDLCVVVGAWWLGPFMWVRCSRPASPMRSKSNGSVL